MRAFWTVLIVLLAVIAFLAGADRLYYAKFVRQAKAVRIQAGLDTNGQYSEADLSGLPAPVANYIRFSGLIGKKKISAARISHKGTFRPGEKAPFYPIRGIYYLTTVKPSFYWYGKIKLFPGISVTAIDSYFNGKGSMRIKAMSLVDIGGTNTAGIDDSAFGRCIAEMTIIPSFFLDRNRIKWTGGNSTSAECVVTDSGKSAVARLYFNPDGSMERIVVRRMYDHGNGRYTPENFTGKGSDYRVIDGVRIPTVLDGYWNLKDGDLHYVHFTITRAEFE